MHRTSFSIYEAGSTSDWKHFQFETLNGLTLSKSFLKNQLDLTAMEVSLNSLPPGASMPFTHRHQINEELYVFLTGSGEFQIEKEIFLIKPGTCIRCDREVHRAWRCTGNEPLTFIVIQAPAGGYGAKATIEDGIKGDLPLAWQ